MKMANVFELNAESREQNGRRASRRLQRVEDRIPAIIYGGDKKPQPISMSHQEVSLALQNEAVYSHILTIKIDGKHEKVVLKDLQRHPWKSRYLHADFLRINESEKLVMNIPLRFVNEAAAPGLKAGGIILKYMTEIEIRCLPGDLPEFLEVDVSKLDIEKSIHLSDIKLPKGVELTIQLTEEQDQPIISIHMPRAAKEETTVGGAAAATPTETKTEEKAPPSKAK